MLAVRIPANDNVRGGGGGGGHAVSRRGGLFLFGEHVSHFQRESGRVGVRDVRRHGNDDPVVAARHQRHHASACELAVDAVCFRRQGEADEIERRGIERIPPAQHARSRMYISRRPRRRLLSSDLGT